MAVEQSSDGATSAMAGDEQRIRRSAGILLEKLAQPTSDGLNHIPSDVKEASVAKVAGIVQEPFGRGGIRVEVDGPVHKSCCAANGKHDGVDIIHGHGFDDHGFGAGSPVGVDMGVSFGALGPFIDSLGILSGETEEGPGGNVQSQRGQIGRQSRVGVEIHFCKVTTRVR